MTENSSVAKRAHAERPFRDHLRSRALTPSLKLQRPHAYTPMAWSLSLSLLVVRTKGLFGPSFHSGARGQLTEKCPNESPSGTYIYVCAAEKFRPEIIGDREKERGRGSSEFCGSTISTCRAARPVVRIIVNRRLIARTYIRLAEWFVVGRCTMRDYWQYGHCGVLIKLRL